jgi:hypothetical protein
MIPKNPVPGLELKNRQMTKSSEPSPRKLDWLNQSRLTSVRDFVSRRLQLRFQMIRSPHSLTLAPRVLRSMSRRPRTLHSKISALGFACLKHWRV